MRVKLVRDGTNISRGRLAPANSVPGKYALLVAKLHEEAAEIARAPKDAEEYADLLEVLLETARMNDVPWALIEDAVLEKRARLGGFFKGMVWIDDEPAALDRRVPRYDPRPVFDPIIGV